MMIKTIKNTAHISYKRYQYIGVFCIVSLLLCSCGFTNDNSMIKYGNEFSKQQETINTISDIDSMPLSGGDYIALSDMKNGITMSVWKLDSLLFDSLVQHVTTDLNSILTYNFFHNVNTISKKSNQYIRFNFCNRTINNNNYSLYYTLNKDSTLAHCKRMGCTVFEKQEEIKGYSWVYNLHDNWYLACYDIYQ
ncbi:MAG: hypothetical protein ABL940_06280 [Bacteroidia bacterium]